MQVQQFNFFSHFFQIIDVYGPWKGSEPEAGIFRYVLENDENINNILLPNKTLVFLDRGLRDIKRHLEEVYHFDVRIPTCDQLEDDGDRLRNQPRRQLTVQQTSDTRMCTKVRWQVEKINSKIKDFRALDQVFNSELGHIMVSF